MAYNRRLWKREAEEEDEGANLDLSTPSPTLDPNVDRAKAFRQHHHHRVTSTTIAPGKINRIIQFN